MNRDDKRRKKSSNKFKIKQGTILRFDGVTNEFELPLKLPEGVKVRRVRIDEPTRVN